jgi:dTDP-4-dehydrorhamnose 3,5-epimerase
MSLSRVIYTEEKQIFHQKGDIFHIMKKSSNGFNGFGEAYFTTVHQGDIKGWKKHTQMTLNLAVPVGEVEFVVTDDKQKEFKIFTLSPDSYHRLTVPPNLWVAFRGVEEYNLVINIADMEHNPEEAINIPLEEIKYEWQ